MKSRKFTILFAACLCAAVLTGCQGSAEPAQTNVDAANEPANYAELIGDISTAQAFTQDAVPQEDISAIVMAGVNAPSAMNAQPWHFSVVTDQDALQQIAEGMSGGKGGMPNFDRSNMPEGVPDGVPEGMPEGAPDGMPEGMPNEMPEDFPADMQKPSEASNAPAAPNGQMPAASVTAKAGIADAPLVIVISCKEGSELDAGLATQNMSAEAQLLGYGTKIISSPTIALNGEKQAEYKELLGIPDDMSAVCVLLIGKTDTEAYDAVSGATTRNSPEEVVTYLQ